MRRRDVLAGGAALAALGGAGALAVTDWQPWEEGTSLEPVELETIEAPGSEAGTTAIPERGRVSVIELFATWCDVCSRQMVPMGAVHDELGDDVRFVSVTNEPLGGTITRDDVSDWWAAHDGAWTVAHDADLDLTTALDAASVPYTVVLDAENEVRWRHSGYVGAPTLRERIAAVQDGSTAVEGASQVGGRGRFGGVDGRKR